MPWSDPIQLRKSSALGSFATDAYLPIRYGRTAGQCARMNARGTRWLWADHAVDGVDSVRLDGLKITGWVWANEIDASGRAIAVITLTEAADASATLFAIGRGKSMANPADVACDALGLSASAMPEFRAACTVAGYIAGGSITEPVTRQTLARSIAASFGATFTPQRLIFFPALTDALQIDVAAIQTSGKPAGEILALFDYADGEHQQSVTLRARAGEQQEVTLAWVQSQRVAIAAATALAIERSGQLWSFDFAKKSSERISAGAAVKFTLHPFGARSAIVTQSAYDFGVTTGTAEFRMPGATTATLVHQSARFSADSASTATITRVGDSVELLVLDDTDVPLSNAKCTLDARMTRYTDAGGKVLFPAFAVDDGLPHSVLVEQTGRPSFTISL